MLYLQCNLQICLPREFISRWGHSATSLGWGDDHVEVIIFGGCSNWPDEVTTANDYIAIAETLIVQLSKGEIKQIFSLSITLFVW